MHLYVRRLTPLLSKIANPKTTTRAMATQHTPSSSDRLNIFSTPLRPHSLQPPTGYVRDGYCHAPASDPGNHSVAAILTPEFLEFSKSRGNDLTSIGLKGGCKWCLCVSRWKEALLAHGRGEVGKDAVPRVVLGATGRRALEGCSVDELVQWKADE
ncbi:hypothetical protein BZA05DRAFT_357513 [Tricharina praecox]|uniref:uncharacterized protein n=1 Tax=Tricharina praecox TaxID=43433 RepID=UPI00221EF141|nr:uncharacterized protein BZA05DRAFT_357513 [Tricharina praecox]KAI5846097.1 hypothetical protein BZA05DRAFT_357513 [Tricharina praecox]